MLKGKRPIQKYIAYFQAYTNTYGPIDHLRSIFTEAIQNPDIVALSIGTRPDCFGKEVLELLDELNQQKPVWLELGLQTIHESTAQYIRRGYSLSCFNNAVAALRERNIEVIVHTILGLPGETPSEILQTMEYLNQMDIQGIKLQLLHVLRGTDLAEDYERGLFCCAHLGRISERADLLFRALISRYCDTPINRRWTEDSSHCTTLGQPQKGSPQSSPP